jgi:hypothetical protein
MFFEKPDVRYVDMCIYIDDHIYTDDYDENLVYQYLFHIILLITMKRNYFNTSYEREDFSLFAASWYYMRLTDKRQFESDSTLEKIKSILNYVTKTLFGVRQKYCKKYVFDREIPSPEFVDADIDGFSMYTQRKIDSIGTLEIKSLLGTANDFIKEYLKDIPYPKDSTIWTNIYISCMLTFLNSVTLRNKDIKRIENFKRPNSVSDTLLNKLYINERYSSTILYHLDDSMYNYITVLTNKIRHLLSTEISQSLHTYTPSFVTMKNLLMSNTSENKDY